MRISFAKYIYIYIYTKNFKNFFQKKDIFSGHNSFKANVRPGVPQSNQIEDKKYTNNNILIL